MWVFVAFGSKLRKLLGYRVHAFTIQRTTREQRATIDTATQQLLSTLRATPHPTPNTHGTPRKDTRGIACRSRPVEGSARREREVRRAKRGGQRCRREAAMMQRVAARVPSIVFPVRRLPSGARVSDLPSGASYFHQDLGLLGMEN